jgi:D-alanyl-D-alanine carboxypeptidase (penicillin-binding protein 5/6)
MRRPLFGRGPCAFRASGRLRIAVAVTAAVPGLLASAGLATPAGAVTGGAGSAVGGPLLAGRGVVVQPLSGAPELPTHLTAKSWLVADLDTGEVLAARGAHVRHLPASTLKVLTAATLIPRLDPSASFTATRRDATVDGTRVGLVPGLRYSIHKLFQAMLIMSANDAADALAEANGGIGRTVADMNAEAARLQAYDTHADTPSGLDGPGESTSAYDLALIWRQAYSLPAFRHYVTTVRTLINAPRHKHYEIYTHNYLLTTYPGDMGGKNGYTVAARATYVGVARRHGHTILISLMDAYPDFWPDARALFGWGFQADGNVSPVGELVPPVPDRTAPVTVRPVAAAATRPSASAPGAVSGDGRLASLSILGASLIILGLVVTRRRRRRPRRLALPPI